MQGLESFNLKLLYKATRDGDEAEKFWNKCNNIGDTFTFIKSKQKKRFGAYR